MNVMHELGSLRMHVVTYEVVTWKKERSEKGLCCFDAIKGAPSTFARVSLSSPQDGQTVKRSPPLLSARAKSSGSHHGTKNIG